MKPREILPYAQELRYTLNVLLRDDLKCYGSISLACCYDVIEHHMRDIERLYAVHQKLVHASKHIAYLTFWIRKLKPVDTSYPISEIERAISTSSAIDESVEVRDVNERICLYYMHTLLKSSAADGRIKPPGVMPKEDFIANIDLAFNNFLTEGNGGPVLDNRFGAVVYDMRYRTFGPHHVVHLVNHILTEASHGGH
jgi:hypothetical protein